MTFTWKGSAYVVSEQRFNPVTFLAINLVRALGIGGVFLLFAWNPPVGLLAYLSGAFVFMYLASGLGITAGYHRYFIHRAFRATDRCAKMLAALGSLAWEQRIDLWGWVHLVHHRYADMPGDPHSPVVPPGSSWWKRLRRFLWAHEGWLYRPYVYPREMQEAFRQTLLRQEAVRWQKKTHYLWATAGLLIPAGIALPFWGVQGFILALLIPGAFRVAWVWNATWFINSGTHLWGSRPNNLKNNARDFLFRVLGLGEEGHNRHHHKPHDPFHGEWWRDWTGNFIRLLKICGLVTFNQQNPQS